MKFTKRSFGHAPEILKYAKYRGTACMVSDVGVTADAHGLKIVKAGTPWPANDDTCLGLLLHDTDVTYGPHPGTYVYDGTFVTDKLTANGITVSDDAKKVLPMCRFD